MKLVSWNVNGFRACLTKGFSDFFCEINADIVALQETKMQQGQADFSPEGYHQYWNSAEKKGYSGTCVLSKQEAQQVSYGIGIEEHDKEGRVITLEFPQFFFVNVYTPNAQRQLARVDYRMAWEDAFQAYVQELSRQKPVILCGDLNVAHEEIDLKNPKQNQNNPGFSPQEREKMTQFLNAGFLDCYRTLYPTETDCYTWWSYMMQAREKNIGWRIDYFLLSAPWKDRLQDVTIHKEVMGSDHCPISMEIEIS